MTIPSATVFDAGEWRCTVVDETGVLEPLVSETFTLTVNDPNITIIEQPQGAAKMKGESHEFDVQIVGGSGDYLYLWQKGDIVLEGTNTPELVLEDLRGEDSGDYVVLVADAADTEKIAVSQRATLTVAAPVNVDFDYYLIVAEKFLGPNTPLRNVDNDGNGILEEDQLGLLRAILGENVEEGCVPAEVITEIQSGFNTNLSRVEDELTVTASGQTVNILQSLKAEDPELAEALQNLLAGYLAIADPGTLTFINTLADEAVKIFLTGTPQSSLIPTVQSQINFTAAAFFTFGAAPNEPDYLGPAGDIDNDTTSNLDEYLAPNVATREDWLLTNCVVPPLRLDEFSAGGSRLAGQQLNFVSKAAGGSGTYLYTWRKGTLASSTVVSTSLTYTIPFALPANSGTYFVQIDDGETVLTSPVVRLTVLSFPLSVFKPLQGGTVAAGSTFTFSVEVQGGSPGPYFYTWRKNGNIVGPNAPTFTISPVLPEDAGQYSVEVTPDGGVTTVSSGPVTLNVSSPPLSISQQPQSVVKNLGDSHTFSVAVQGGSGVYVYDWRLGTTSLGAPSQPTLTIEDIQIADAGQYRVFVADAANSNNNVLSNTAQLAISLGPLSITQQPVGASRGAGTSYTFTVAASGGSGSYTYDWQKNGVSLNKPSLPTLTLNSITSNDAGTYRVLVKDLLDATSTVLSNAAVLTVGTAPLAIAQQPVGGVVNEGEDFTFTVVAGGGSGSYSYEWQKDGVNLGAPSAPSYTVEDAEIDDRGAYRVIVRDTVQTQLSVTSNSVNLGVISGGFAITQQPQGGIRYEGESITLAVLVTGGSGDFKYTWRRSGQLLVGQNTNQLVLANLTEADEGIYSCLIEDNLVPEIAAFTTPAQLVVGPPITISQQPQNRVLAPGSNTTLEISASGGIGTLSYTWLKDGEPVPGGPNSPVISLLNVDAGDEGAYSVSITDDRGETLSQTGFVEVYRSLESSVRYFFKLTEDQVVPATGSAATGLGVATVEPLGAPSAGALLSLQISHNAASPINVFLLRGEPGTAGQLVSNLGDALSPLETVVGLPASVVNDLLRGRLSVAITTDGFPSGEIRGFLVEGAIPPHSADTDENYVISLTELLRVIQFFNVGGYRCGEGTIDGYQPGTSGTQDCANHSSDYSPTDWKIQLQELLRLIQFFNLGGYKPDPSGPDGYSAGPA